MTAGILYAIGTLAAWVGWLGLAWAIYQGLRLAVKPPGIDRAVTSRTAVFWLILGALGILVNSVLPMNPGRPQPTGWHVPVVWLVTSFWMWTAMLSGFMALLRVCQGWLDSRVSELSSARFKSAGIWLLFGVAMVFVHFKSEGEFLIVRGAIGMQPKTAIGLILLGIAVFGLMILTARAAALRAGMKTFAAHIALIAGSIVFGLPFAWLVITSFKEDRDMSSPNGIVWVPRVQDTVPYMDPDEPLYLASYQGSTVQATRIEKNVDGTVKLDIFKPMALRGISFDARPDSLREIPKDIPIVSGTFRGKKVTGKVIKDLDDGRRSISIIDPPEFKGQVFVANPADVEPVRHIGLRFQNYPDALDFLPPETSYGLVYLKNTLIIVILSVVGTLLSSSIVAYAFSRMRFPGREFLFTVLLSTMMLPAAVTLMPQFLIFRGLGWIDTLYPLWVPAFVGSAFNIFLLRQFFMGVPMELEDAAKIDGCSYWRSFWGVMLPQVKPALAVIAIWTFMAAWNNFMGPLIYVNSPEHMPISYAVQLFQSDRSNEPGLLMAFATLAMLPVLLLFFFAQKYFIEGVTLSGLGGR